MLAKYGTMSLREVLAPAMDLASGFPADIPFARSVARNKKLIEQWPYSKAVFITHSGEEKSTPQPGEIFVQKDLLKTLEKMVEAEKLALKAGKNRYQAIMAAYDRFYKGDIAQEFVRGSMEQGGLITDFPKGTKPDRQHFPRRNRITAGLCDALLVIESGIQGGSLITAGIANSYHKEVFAIPGPVIQSQSGGCNELIKKNQAQLVCHAADIVECMNWMDKPVKKELVQPSLFPTMSPEETSLLHWLQQHAPAPIDLILEALPLPRPVISQVLLSLEMQGLIRQEPGKIYRIL